MCFYAIVYKTLKVIQSMVWGNFNTDKYKSLKYFVETIIFYLLWMMPTTKYWWLPWNLLEWSYMDKNSMFFEKKIPWRKLTINGMWDDILNPKHERERESWLILSWLNSCHNRLCHLYGRVMLGSITDNIHPWFIRVLIIK